MLESTGYLIYYPNWWIVLRCCDDLARYYRRSLRIKSLAPPPYNSHITIVNGGAEEPPDKTYWGKYDGEEVEFSYGSDVYSDAGYYWVRVECERLHRIREELGLSRTPHWPFHLTIAKDISNV